MPISNNFQMKQNLGSHKKGILMRYLFFITLLFFAFTFQNCSASKSATGKSETTFFFVRHAEKAKDGTKDPPLTDTGRQRAERLAKLLENEKVSFVYSTDYKRTRETAQPTVDLFNLDLQIYNHKTIDINALAQEKHGQTVLVVGHSNSTPALTNDLIGEEQFAKFDESDYGNILKVVIWDGEKKAEAMRY